MSSTRSHSPATDTDSACPICEKSPRFLERASDQGSVLCAGAGMHTRRIAGNAVRNDRIVIKRMAERSIEMELMAE